MKIFFNLILVLSIMLFTQSCTQTSLQTFSVKKHFCKDPENVGKIGIEGDCLGKLIVDDEMLKIIVNGEYKKKGKLFLVVNNETVLVEELKEKNKVSSLYDHKVIYTGQVNDLSNLFRGMNEINGDITGWDVSNVQMMENMFSDSNFNQDISKWDVSSVRTMKNMFYNNKKFNQPIGCWNIKSLIKVDNIFIGADNFEQKIGNWKKHIENLEFKVLEHQKNEDKFKDHDKVSKNILLKSIYENVSEDEFYQYAVRGGEFFNDKVLEELKPIGKRLEMEICN